MGNADPHATGAELEALRTEGAGLVWCALRDLHRMRQIMESVHAGLNGAKRVPTDKVDP